MVKEKNKGKNKGEWSEYYTFLKLLADGKIFAADKNLNKNEKIFYIIIKIIRGSEEDFEYIRSNRIIIQNSKGETIKELPIEEIIEDSKSFYKGISNGEIGKRSFKLEFAQSVLDKLHTTTLSDELVETADIRIVIHDPITQHEPLLGFSIKSYLGVKPTLFNASKTTNLIYKIDPELNVAEIEWINQLDNYAKRIKWLTENGYKLKFFKMNNEVFKTNLELIDSKLPEILSHLILHKFIAGTSSLDELTKFLNESNPCSFNINLNPNFYTYKIKRLLVDTALGMKAGKLWSGTFNATGGYIAVKKDGELVCYHIYNWNDFQEYLLTHTKIDLPASSSKRCDYGRILLANEVEEEHGTYIKLNFQIRFK